jgi:hypothetical protein
MKMGWMCWTVCVAGLEGLCGKGRKDVPLVRMLRSLLHMRYASDALGYL